MAASRFVGRVGGLAVALGVGVAIASAPGVAFADDGGADSAAPAHRSEAAGPSSSDSSTSTRATRLSAVRAQNAARNKRPPAPAASVTRAHLTPGIASSSAAETGATAPSLFAAAAGPAAGEDGAAADSSPPDVIDPSVQIPEPVAADPDSVSDVVMYAAGGGTSDGTEGNPRSPLEALSWALLAAVRRDGLSASATSSAITVAPSTFLVNGVITGNLNAESTGGNPLTLEFVGSRNGGKLDLGTVPGGIEIGGPQSYTILPYANWLDPGQVKGTQEFTVRVTETTALDEILVNIPLVGMLAGPIIGLLQQTPFVGDLLAPLIGASILATIEVDVADLAPGDTPVAYTYKVASFDGTLISTNFFPASGLIAGQTAPTLLNGPGLGGAGTTNPYSFATTSNSVPGLAVLRDAGYNVVTWDPRGEFASGGILQLDNPFYEGRDTSALIDWLSAYTPAVVDGRGDPTLGMVGGSYSGAIQMTSVDPRIDAIAPTITWNSLNESLYPSGIFKTAWANYFALALLTTGARVNGQVYPNLLLGNLFGFITESAQALLGSSGPTALLNQLQAPTMLIQGTADALFPLAQSIENAQTILANPYGVPVKMIWFCGGHGVCLDEGIDPVAQVTQIFNQELTMMAILLQDFPAPLAVIPNFTWWDQAGDSYTSELYPFSPGFNQAEPLTATGDGGRLFMAPLIKGSGANKTSCDYAPACEPPLNQVFATEAKNAINVAIVPTPGDQVVGAPTVTFDYTGLGTNKAVFAQIVDNTTGRVLGNIVSPIPVVLDGKKNSVSVQLADIAYTAGADPSLTLQIVGRATLYRNHRIGTIDISNIRVDLPLVDQSQ